MTTQDDLRIFRLYGNEYIVAVTSVLPFEDYKPKAKARVLLVISDPCPALKHTAKMGQAVIADSRALYALGIL